MHKQIKGRDNHDATSTLKPELRSLFSVAILREPKDPEAAKYTKPCRHSLVRISGFLLIFPVIAAFSAHWSECAENIAIAENRKENPDILTKY